VYLNPLADGTVDITYKFPKEPKTVVSAMKIEFGKNVIIA